MEKQFNLVDAISAQSQEDDGAHEMGAEGGYRCRQFWFV